MDPCAFPVDLVWGGPECTQNGLGHSEGDFSLT